MQTPKYCDYYRRHCIKHLIKIHIVHILCKQQVFKIYMSGLYFCLYLQMFMYACFFYTYDLLQFCLWNYAPFPTLISLKGLIILLYQATQSTFHTSQKDNKVFNNKISLLWRCVFQVIKLLSCIFPHVLFFYFIYEDIHLLTNTSANILLSDCNTLRYKCKTVFFRVL